MARRVLLIEDEGNIVEAISYFLTRDGWTVHVHSDGLTAMDRLRALPPDAVILDAMLPGRSGFDILRDLRADPGLASLPVMMLTARSQARDRAMAMDLGATMYMTKPFANADIISAVRQMTGG
jgi:DNA-binding response OmpR family regulator